MTFDCLIIGGSVAGISCGLILGSAHKKPFMADKKIGIIAHQRASALQDALFNNAYGIPAGTLGKDILAYTTQQIKDVYPHIEIIENQKITSINSMGAALFEVHSTNDTVYYAKNVVIAVGNTNLFHIEGLMHYVEPHQKSIASKNRIQLKNTDHLVSPGIYVAGTLAGHRSQLAIAAGSGAAVGTDLMVKFNDGNETQSHDSIKKV